MQKWLSRCTSAAFLTFLVLFLATDTHGQQTTRHLSSLPRVQAHGATIHTKDAQQNPWVQLAKLTASNDQFGQFCGTSVGISGDTVVLASRMTKLLHSDSKLLSNSPSLLLAWTPGARTSGTTLT